MEGYEPKIGTLAKECEYKNRDTINCSKVGGAWVAICQASVGMLMRGLPDV